MSETGGTPVSEIDVGAEVRKAPEAEPLLPIEKKLIGWSLGLGVALLVILFAATRA